MKHPDRPDPERIALALHAVGDTCTELAAEGCRPAEIATALASLLGVVTAAVTCCPEHAAQAEQTVVEIYWENLASHRIRFAALERVGEAGISPQEGHA